MQQPLNITALVVAVASAVVLSATLLISAPPLVLYFISNVSLGMYMYRRHQAKYLNLTDEQGNKVSFVELNDHVSFGSDTLQFSEITYTLSMSFISALPFADNSFSEGKRVLHGLSGVARPGQVTAILGASGAGKTTLLDLLARRAKRGEMTGNVYLNGEHLSAAAFSRLTAYVDQEPAVLGTQSVREILITAAQLRLPEVVTYQEKVERMMSIARELKIEAILDRKYGEVGDRGISGGEKRRVQIACQLITGPSVVFLDEVRTAA